MFQLLENHISAHRDMAKDNGWFWREPSPACMNDMRIAVDAFIAKLVYDNCIIEDLPDKD